MPISFDDFFARACEASGAKTQMELAAILGINRSAITQAKRRDAVPEKWLLGLSRKFAVSPDWLEHGDKYQKNILKPLEVNLTRSVSAGADPLSSLSHAGSAYRSGLSHAGPASKPFFRHDEPDGDFSEIVSIPKISAVLCAGGGSFEVENAVIGHIPLLSPFVRRLGNPSSLVFMDVSGDSMEPGIFHGDTVLIDQSVKNFQNNTVMAVGHDESIFIKRLQKQPGGGLALLSDNHDYEPIRLAGDELASFRILGKLVWLFRKVN